MSELLTIGNTTITVADETFANAFQIGYLRFKVDYLNKPLTDMDIYALYVGTMPACNTLDATSLVISQDGSRLCLNAHTRLLPTL